MIIAREPKPLVRGADSLRRRSLQDSDVMLDSSKAFASLTRRPMPWWKRLFDVVVASILLVVLSPLLLAIAVYIRCVSRGPILFAQKRLGEMGSYFTILKFRTLHPTCPRDATSKHREFVANLTESQAVAAKPDLTDRMIPGGKFLRSHSFDELPQLINVLRGEMTLIGPRPDVLDWNDYPQWQLRRFEVTPGITGLWQVSGKNRLTFSQMVELDIRYIENRSFRLDMWILFKTFRLVLSKDNN